MTTYILSIYTGTHLVFILLVWDTEAVRNFDKTFVDSAYNRGEKKTSLLHTSATCINVYPVTLFHSLTDETKFTIIFVTIRTSINLT